MGHRALVAYARGAGRYDCHYSHWGGADVGLAGRLSDPDDDPVTADPVARGADFATVVGAHLDPLVHEALYVVAGETRSYRTLWLDVASTADAPAGLLVEVIWTDPCDDDRVRAWFRGAHAVAAARAERGALSGSEAATVIERCLREWAGDREVIRPPAAGRD